MSPPLYLPTLRSPDDAAAGPARRPGPPPANLGQYFGNFYSDELDVSYTLSFNANGNSVAVTHEKLPDGRSDRADHGRLLQDDSRGASFRNVRPGGVRVAAGPSPASP